MKFLYRFLPFILLFLLTVTVNAQKKVSLQGTWEKVSAKYDGKPEGFNGRQIKLITAKHYVWLKHDLKVIDSLYAKGTLRDSLAAHNDEFGGGTYKIEGDTYTETTEFFGDPKYIGRSISFKFTLKGNIWNISGHYVHYDANGKKTDEFLLDETWKRID